jgi:predicted XRE-type DNA-binding protein
MTIEESSGNVYADLEATDADEMQVKAQLSSKIGEIVKARMWSQKQAAEVLGMTQPKLSQILRAIKARILALAIRFSDTCTADTRRAIARRADTGHRLRRLCRWPGQAGSRRPCRSLPARLPDSGK